MKIFRLEIMKDNGDLDIYTDVTGLLINNGRINFLYNVYSDQRLETKLMSTIDAITIKPNR